MRYHVVNVFINKYVKNIPNNVSVSGRASIIIFYGEIVWTRVRQDDSRRLYILFSCLPPPQKKAKITSL